MLMTQGKTDLRKNVALHTIWKTSRENFPYCLLHHRRLSHSGATAGKMRGGQG